MTEVRNSTEGSLRWVQASGSGSTWATASAPASGLIGYVSNVTFTSARDVQVISNRGIPSHHKFVAKTPVSVQFDLQWGITGDYPPMNVTGSGATVQMVHLELKSTAAEDGSALYHQIHGVSINSMAWTETTPANTMQFQGVGLAMVGPTASGYLG